MKKILCNDKPPISCYPEYGFLFSLIDDIKVPWVMNNFIEFEVVPEWEMFISFVNHDCILKECPYISESILKRSELGKEAPDIVSLAVKSITEDTCLFLFLDRFYINGTEEYHLKHYMHNSFVVGCDTDREVVYLADNFNDGKYSVIECGFEDFKNAFQRDPESHVCERKLQDSYSGDLVKYLKDILENKKEAYVFAERSDIKAFKAGFPMAHDLKIVGHDDKKNCFFIEDHYTKNPIVSCSYEEIKEAYRRFPKQEQLDEIVVLKKTEPKDAQEIDIEKIVASLEEYLHPQAGETRRDGFTVSHNMFSLEFIADKAWILGATRYRFWQFLYERAMIMEARVRRLTELKLIDAGSDFEETFTGLKKAYLLLRNLIIKADIEKEDIDSSFMGIMAQVISKEKESVTGLIEKLKAHISDCAEA